MKILDDEKDLLLNHEYDGIRELDNHMPVWWLWLFYFTIAFGVGYMAYYYVFDLGMDQHEEYAAEMAAAEELYANNEPDPGESTQVTWAYLNEEERIQEGKEIFMSTNNLCFTCHGNNGEGLVGPNLTDDMWIHGCSPEEVVQSIASGFPEKGMMPYGSSTPIEDDKMLSLISYIASLQGTNPPNAKAADPNRAQPCTIN